jgi:peptidoglycan hydrolase-like protein with peptidoglycan-binding domain
MTGLQPLFGSLYDFANKRFNFKRPPKLFLKQDDENAMDTFGKTAFYNPNEESITIFVSQRHPKDILRSFAHELIHHGQNLNGELAPEKCGEMGPGYAQNNEYMRDLEMKAFRDGNLCFRDWEDTCKQQRSSLKENKIQKENKQMTTQISKENLKNSTRRTLKEGNAAAAWDMVGWGGPRLAGALGELLHRSGGDDFRSISDQEMVAFLGAQKDLFGGEAMNPNLIQKVVSLKNDGTLDHPMVRAWVSVGKLSPLPTQTPSVRESTEKRTVKIPKSFLKDVIGKILKEQDNMSRELDGGMSTPDIASYPQIPGMSDPEVEEKGDKQERLLGKAGFRNMEQLQKMVGADVTGVYDQQTMDKIVRFQNRLGVKADGLFGPATARALKRSGTASDIASMDRALAKLGEPDSRLGQFDADVAAGMGDIGDILGKVGEPFEDEDLAKMSPDEEENATAVREAHCVPAKRDEDESIAVRESEELIESPSIKAVQKKLGVPADGRIGPKTKAAIMKFQKQNQLKADGILGAETLKLLMKESEELDEAGCGSAKRDDELEEAKKCPHCDGDAPRSECICGKMNESEELEEKMGVTRQGKKCKCGDPGCGGCEALEEAVPTVSADELDDDDVKDGPGDMSVKDGKLVKVKEAFKIQTPEQEKNLYESRFGKRNDELFNKLTKLWSKSK